MVPDGTPENTMLAMAEAVDAACDSPSPSCGMPHVGVAAYGPYAPWSQYLVAMQDLQGSAWADQAVCLQGLQAGECARV